MNYKSELKYQTFFEPLRQKKCHEFNCYFIWLVMSFSLVLSNYKYLKTVL